MTAEPAPPPSPQTTLAIVAGASVYDKHPALAHGPSFAKSAGDFVEYLRDPLGLSLPDQNILNLFDRPDPQSVLLEAIEGFIERRGTELEAANTPVRDLILYYLGHGGFTQDKKYRLAVRDTRKGSEDPSSIRMIDLASAITRKAAAVRKYLFLDCCFSAVAFRDWQSTMQSAPTEVMRVQTQEAMSAAPGMGTTMLCSSSAVDWSEAPADKPYTMFSGALIHALREGLPHAGPRLSMAQIGRQVAQLISKEYKSDSVRPEVLCPDQREDETKDIALFPNPAARQRIFDCTITVLDADSIAIQYADEKGDPQTVKGQIGDSLPFLTVQRIDRWISLGLALEQDQTFRTSVSESSDGSWQLRSADDLKVVGMSLLRLLVGDDKLRDCFCGLYNRFQDALDSNAGEKPQMRVRLAFRPPAEELARLPWEFLFVPKGDERSLDAAFFAGQRTELIFTRQVASAARAPEPKLEKLRILVAVYTPKDESGIGAVELGALLARFSGIGNTTVVDLQDAPLAALSKALRQVKPHVFHFIGYGTRDEKGGLTFVGQSGDAEGRVYQPDEKRPLPQRGDELFSLFNYPSKPGVVFLHGRKSSGPLADAFQRQESLKRCARDLASRGLPAVITMQFAIANEEIADFAARVYTELALGRGPDVAVQAGRIALGDMYPSWIHPRFGAPLVFLQGDDPLVSPPVQEKDKSDAQTGEAAPAAISGGGVSNSPQRVAAPDARKDSAPAPAPKGKDEAPSSFEGR